MKINYKDNSSQDDHIDFNLIKRIILRSKFLILIATILAPIFSFLVLPNLKEVSTTGKYKINLTNRILLPDNFKENLNAGPQFLTNKECSNKLTDKLIEKMYSDSFYQDLFVMYMSNNKKIKDKKLAYLKNNLKIESVSKSIQLVEFTSVGKFTGIVLDNYVDFINFYLNDQNYKCFQKIITQYNNSLDKNIINYDPKLKNILKEYINYLEFEKSKVFEYISISNKFIEINDKETSIYSLIVSLTIIYFILFIIIILKENFFGNIHEKNMLKEKLNINYLDTIYKNKSELNNKIINKSINQAIKNKNNAKICIYNLENKFINKSSIELVNNLPEFKLINIEDIRDVKEEDYIIVFAESGKINLSRLSTINKYFKIYSDKIIGWFFIDEL